MIYEDNLCLTSHLQYSKCLWLQEAVKNPGKWFGTAGAFTLALSVRSMESHQLNYSLS